MNCFIDQAHMLTFPTDATIPAIKNGKMSAITHRCFSTSDTKAKHLVENSSFCFPSNHFPIGWFDRDSDVDPGKGSSLDSTRMFCSQIIGGTLGHVLPLIMKLPDTKVTWPHHILCHPITHLSFSGKQSN